MRWVGVCGRALIALVAMQCLAFAGDEEERTRTFPELKCRFTLPNSDWEWVEMEHVHFAAVNSAGISVRLTASHHPGVEVGKIFANSFDKEFFIPGERERRGGEFITFLGLPCYEVRGRLKDSTSSSMRIFAAHGYIYNVIVMGSSEPVENDPAYQEVLRGFEFTSPPEAKRTGYAPGSDEERAYLLGRVTGMVCAVCAFGSMGALLLWVILRAGRKGDRSGKSSPKRPQPESIFFEDDEDAE